MKPIVPILLTVLVSVVSNEIWDLSSVLAVRIARLAGRLWGRDADERARYVEELEAHVTERPGRVLKLLTALNLLAGGMLRQTWNLGTTGFLIARLSFTTEFFQYLTLGVAVLVELSSYVLATNGTSHAISLTIAILGWAVAAVGFVAIRLADKRRMHEEALLQESQRQRGLRLMEENSSASAVINEAPRRTSAPPTQIPQRIRPYLSAAEVYLSATKIEPTKSTNSRLRIPGYVTGSGQSNQENLADDGVDTTD